MPSLAGLVLAQTSSGAMSSVLVLATLAFVSWVTWFSPCCWLMTEGEAGESVTIEELADPGVLLSAVVEAARASNARILFSCLTNSDLRRRISSMSSSTTLGCKQQINFNAHKKIPMVTYRYARTGRRRRCLGIAGVVWRIRNSRLGSRRTPRWHFA